MGILFTAFLIYLAIGAVCFAHPVSPAIPDDFHWRGQIEVFRATFADVIAWPMTLWRLSRSGAGRL